MNAVIEEMMKRHAEKVKGLREIRDKIDEAISKEFDGYRLPCKFIDELVEQYGLQKVREVVAISIKLHDYDGRFGRDNVAWALAFETELWQAARYEVDLRSHRVLIDAVATELRRR